MSLPIPVLLETITWLQEQERQARADCERLMAESRLRAPDFSTPESARVSLEFTVILAMATARLETIQEHLAPIVRLVGR